MAAAKVHLGRIASAVLLFGLVSIFFLIYLQLQYLPEHSEQRDEGGASSELWKTIKEVLKSKPKHYVVQTEVSAVRAETSSRFLCWTIDLTDDREFFDLDFRDNDLRFLARELAVASSPFSCFVRIGGTGADYLTYLGNGTHGCREHSIGQVLPSRIDAYAQQKKYYVGGERCLTKERLDGLISFLKYLRTPAIFGLNIERRNGSRWDPANARELLNHAQSRNYHFAGLQLGNEVNLEISAEDHVADLERLTELLRELYPNPRAARPFIVGPDPHSLHRGPRRSRYERSIVNYLRDYARQISGRNFLKFTAVSHHEYIQVVVPDAMSRDDVDGFESGTVQDSVPNLLDPAWLDRATAVGNAVKEAVHSESPCKELWISELGPHNAGRPTCIEGGRWANFGNSLWYMDTLATKAALGYNVVCRQSFIGADYSLLDCATREPLPDYYASLLWMRIMGPRVLTTRVLENVAPRTDAYKSAEGEAHPDSSADFRWVGTEAFGRASDGSRPLVRAYAHCAKSGPGVSFLIINLSRSEVVLQSVDLVSEPAIQSITRHLSMHMKGTAGHIGVAPAFRRVIEEHGEYRLANTTELLEMQERMQTDFVYGRVEPRKYPRVMSLSQFQAEGRTAEWQKEFAFQNATFAVDEDSGGKEEKTKAESGKTHVHHSSDASSEGLGDVRVDYVMTSPTGSMGGMEVALNGRVLKPRRREAATSKTEEQPASFGERMQTMFPFLRGGKPDSSGKPGSSGEQGRRKQQRPPILSLPKLYGRVVNATETPIRLPPMSYGFFEYPDAKASACTQNTKSIRERRTRCLAVRSDAAWFDEQQSAQRAAAEKAEATKTNGQSAKAPGPLKFEIETAQ